MAVVLDGPITDDWLAALVRFQSLPGVKKNVLPIALVMGGNVEKRFLKKFDGVVLPYQQYGEYYQRNGFSSV